MPLHATTAARAAIALPASRPWQPVELGLVDLPDAARAAQEGQRHRTAHLQHVTRPDLGHARCAAATAAQTVRRDGAIASSPVRAGGRKAARAVDVQLQAWRAMSPIVWNGSARSITRTVTPQLVRSRYVSSDSTLRHASAQQCLQTAARSTSIERPTQKCQPASLRVKDPRLAKIRWLLVRRRSREQDVLPKFRNGWTGLRTRTEQI